MLRWFFHRAQLFLVFFHKHILCTVAVLFMKFLNFFSVFSERIQHTILAVNTTHIFLYFTYMYIYMDIRKKMNKHFWLCLTDFHSRMQSIWIAG